MTLSIPIWAFAIRNYALAAWQKINWHKLALYSPFIGLLLGAIIGIIFFNV